MKAPKHGPVGTVLLILLPLSASGRHGQPLPAWVVPSTFPTHTSGSTTMARMSRFYSTASSPSIATPTRPLSNPPVKPSSTPKEGAETRPAQVQWRRLGSFEKLLTRQFHQTGDRLSIPHVCAAIVSGPCDVKALEGALQRAVVRHPLLRACIKGDGKVEGAPVAGVRAGAVEPRPLVWCPCDLTTAEVVQQAFQVIDARAGGLASDWQSRFQQALDDTQVDLQQGPLWSLRVVVSPREKEEEEESFALLFAFNHAMSDQISTNTLIHEILTDMQQQQPPAPSNDEVNAIASAASFPPSIEEAVLGADLDKMEPPAPGLNTVQYVLRQGLLGFLPFVLLPHTYDADRPVPSGDRRTICEFRTLEAESLQALQQRCRAEGVTVTAALAAAMIMTASDFAHGPEDKDSHLYRFLLSLNMRAFPATTKQQTQTTQGAASGNTNDDEQWGRGAVACAGGAMDFVTRLPANSGRAFKKAAATTTTTSSSSFWSLARECRGQFLDFVSRGWVPESVLLFDWGMRMVEINDVVEKEADNPRTAGRAYTCGVSNMGVFAPPQQAAAGAGGCGGDASAGVVYGPRRLTAVHYATSHSLTGSLYQLSCGTVGGRLCLTLHYPQPLVDRAVAQQFAEAYTQILQAAMGGPNE